MKFKKKIFYCFIFMTVVVGGCRAEDPPSNQLDSKVPDLSLIPDMPAGCPSPPTLQAPVLNQYTNPTTHSLQVFRGFAPGATHITAESSAQTSKLWPVGQDSSFCVEVRLIEDAQNSVRFIPLDSQGCFGKETTITIIHESSATPDAGGSSLPTNVALNMSITSSASPGVGVLTSIVDGSISTWADLGFRDYDITSTCDEFAWIKVDLGKIYTISEFKIQWAAGAGNDYATCYSILLSQNPFVGDPDPQGADWIVAKEEKSGSAGAQTIQITPESAQIAALLLYENAGTGFFWESFRIAEFEVWGQDPNVVPPPPPDSCE